MPERIALSDLAVAVLNEKLAAAIARDLSACCDRVGLGFVVGSVASISFAAHRPAAVPWYNPLVLAHPLHPLSSLAEAY